MATSTHELGAQLMEVVRRYAALGDHRTGDAADAPTAAWLAEEIRARGGEPTLVPYDLDRYVASWAVRVDGVEVASLPLFYEGVGAVRTSRPAVGIGVPRSAGGERQDLDGLDAVLTTARADGRPAAVVATAGPTGGLVAINREPVAGSGIPTLLVPGRLGDALALSDREVAVDVEIEARVEPGRSTSVVGHFGPSGGEPVVVATPLSGWFRCAGERGTGIAAALHLATRLAEHHPVVLLASTGHELAHLGAHALAPHAPSQARAIVHVGASVAAAAEPVTDPATARLSPTRFARAHAGPHRDAVIDRIAAALAPAGLTPTVPTDPTDPEGWIGEARRWAHRDEPMLSVAGGFFAFHTPDDLPEVSTTPTLLATVAVALEHAVGALVDR
ncbi:MAG TPA: hypothetical protein VK866_03005 [Acidimicrobiales bacterium]|nr:hypothetical protein [Acidimicrobiales bacterium]